MRRTLRYAWVGLVGFAPLVVGRHCAAAATHTTPPQWAAKWCRPGPYPVGCRTVVYVDSSRTDVTTQRPRELVTEIWYPAVDQARGKPTADFKSFFLGKYDEAVDAMKRYGEKISIGDAAKRFDKAITAVRDADKRQGTFPLIVFSHGNGGIRFQSIFLTEHLASHGFIVVAPDHTGNAAVAPLPEGIVTMNAKGSLAAVEDRPRDVSFLIDEMTRENGDSKSFLHDGINLDEIGVTGHSFGGITTTIATRDKRVKAIVPLAGVAPASLAFHTPVLLMVADQDKTIGEKRSKMFLQIYKMWPARKWLVEFKDAGHFTFSEMHRIDPNHGDGVGKGKRFDGSEFTYWDSLDVQQYIKAYELAFFDAVLKGDQKALKLLNGPPLNPNIRTEHSEEQPKQVADK